MCSLAVLEAKSPKSASLSYTICRRKIHPLCLLISSGHRILRLMATSCQSSRSTTLPILYSIFTPPSLLCVSTLLCLFVVRTYVMAVRGYLDNPGPPHLKTFNLVTSAKNVFCKPFNIYSLKGLRLDMLEGDISLLTAD